MRVAVGKKQPLGKKLSPQRSSETRQPIRTRHSTTRAYRTCERRRLRNTHFRCETATLDVRRGLSTIAHVRIAACAPTRPTSGRHCLTAVRIHDRIRAVLRAKRATETSKRAFSMRHGGFGRRMRPRKRRARSNRRARAESRKTSGRY